MKHLAVFLNQTEVGTLAQTGGGLLEFRYTPKWLQNLDAVPLSRMLPLQPESFRGTKARAFFAGILPEEGPRRQIAAILGISESNDFAMLERIGGECAGAVSLFPEGLSPGATEERRVHNLNEKELQEIIEALPRRPLLAGEKGVRLSLAGAQDKLPIILQGSQIALPLGHTPSTHIIKPEPDRFPGLAANEFLCLTLAKSVGLNVAEVAYRRVGTKSCLIVRRYDRMAQQDGAAMRLHQEDFCQALGFPPERKYQQEGGPLLRDCITLLREWSTTPVLDIREFLDGQIFNVLIGNADAHGKNYSMLYQGGERRLAPFYDLVCTLAWPELSSTPAMKIGKANSMNAILPGHWKAMAKETNLGWPMIRDRMGELSQKVQSMLDAAQAQSEGIHGPMSAQVADTILKRAISMQQSLSA